MSRILSIPDIERGLLAETERFRNYCSSLSNEQFFYQPEGKWSPAQQVKHLITSTKMARLPFILPRFLVRGIGGKPNRESRTFEELVARYHSKLEKGGRASGRYIPKPVPADSGKEKMLDHFTKAMNRLAQAMKKKWSEPELDKYLAPHPLLRKITLRELCYFTMYHTTHHLLSIRGMTEKATPS